MIRRSLIHRMAPLLAPVALVLAGLALSGCGATAGASPSAKPLVTFPDLGYRKVPPRLPAGVSQDSVLVVDLTNAAAVRPASLVLGAGVTLNGAHWTTWGAPSASGRGTATVRICSPSCGGGHNSLYPAAVVLDQIKACSGHRFYTEGSVTFTTAEGARRFGLVLRDPC